MRWKQNPYIKHKNIRYIFWTKWVLPYIIHKTKTTWKQTWYFFSGLLFGIRKTCIFLGPRAISLDNGIPQVGHLCPSSNNEVTNLWVFMCFLQLTDVLKVFWQYGHMKGRTSLWVDMCRFRLPLVVNVVSQIRHLYALTPEWVRECAFNTPLETNDRKHVLHRYGFSPEKRTFHRWHLPH